MTEYAVVYEEGQTNWSAYVPDLPGCVAVGKDKETVERRIISAIELHIRGLEADRNPIPAQTHTVGTVRVVV